MLISSVSFKNTIELSVICLSIFPTSYKSVNILVNDENMAWFYQWKLTYSYVHYSLHALYSHYGHGNEVAIYRPYIDPLNIYMWWCLFEEDIPQHIWELFEINQKLWDVCRCQGQRKHPVFCFFHWFIW